MNDVLYAAITIASMYFPPIFHVMKVCVNAMSIINAIESGCASVSEILASHHDRIRHTERD